MTHRTGLLLAILICSLSAVGVGTSVTDTMDLDRRLDKKVTIEVVHTNLADLAERLTRQTGVTIRARTSNKDWKVRERKVTVIARDMTTGDHAVRGIARRTTGGNL